MIILDTDHMTFLEQLNSPERERLQNRLRPFPEAEKSTTIISFEEQMRGWLAYLAQARSVKEQIDAYRRLLNQLHNYCRIRVLEFEEHAATKLQRLLTEQIRIGTMDLKIASIVLAHDALLLSRNLSDFRKVTGWKVGDWTQ